MGRLLRLLVALVALSTLGSPTAEAQRRTFPEELPDDASAGPPFDPARARAASLTGSIPRTDYSDPSVPVALSFHLGVGYAMPSSIDRALATHLYADQNGGPMVTGDFQVTYRALEWLWLGGRFGFRGRGWGRDGAAGAQGGGFDLLAILHVRGQLGRVFELGAMVGAGAGLAGILINSSLTVGPAPRLSGGAELAFRLGMGIRLQVRVSWDYFPWFDLDRFGSDMDLGGPSAAIGLEVRS